MICRILITEAEATLFLTYFERGTLHEHMGKTLDRMVY